MNTDKTIIEKVFTKEEEKIDAKVNKLTAKYINSETDNFNIDKDGNLSVNKITTREQQKVFLPVGTIYWNDLDITDTISTYFEGTWERVKDVFILAAGDKFAGGTNGGEENHFLTIDEMPSHSHSFFRKRLFYDEEVFSDAASSIGSDEVMGQGTTIQPTYATGGSNPHNNMPPYHTAYCWKRIS